MSESQRPPIADPTPTDPHLDTGAYDPAPNHSPTNANLPQSLPEFPPEFVFNPDPISYYIPGEAPVEPAPRAARRRDPEERPSWLPENWTIELRRRNSGASAGQTDRYYIEPTGKRRFRSKVEVLHFLETGSIKRKRKAPSETETTSSRSPASQT